MKSKNIYRIPFPKKIKILAVSDPRAHFGHFKDAIDFILPPNTPIIASKEGIIEEIRLKSKQGGIDKKFADLKYLNYIILKHKNKEYSTYGHLKYERSNLKKGDKVKKGEIIAYSGKSGLMIDPHLHFHVFKKKQNQWKTIKPIFESKFKIYAPEDNPKEYSQLFNFLKKKKEKSLKKS